LARLSCTRPRLEAALANEPSSFACPNIARCSSASAGCRVFAPGWYCAERDLVVLPDLLLDADYEPGADDEPNGDDEPDDDYS
jgi:hypothetical protein